MHKICLAYLLFLCPAVSAAEAPTLDEVRIESFPKEWGYAHKTWKGKEIKGAHMSGGPKAPRIYETQEKMRPESIAKMRQLAEALQKTPEPSEAERKVPDQKTTGFLRVTLSYSDGTQRTWTAVWEQKFKLKEVQEIWDILASYHVGAW